MSVRKPHTIKQPEIDQNFDRLFESRVSGRYYRTSASAITLQPFPTLETGLTPFSANGSQTTSRAIPLKERPSTIINAIAHAMSVGFLATVTDITQCQITIACTAWSQTAGRGFSLTTTATVMVYYQVLGSSP